MNKESLSCSRLLVVVWVLGAIGAAILVAVTYGRTWRIDYKARMTELSVCSGLDQVTRSPVPMTHPITVGASEITICGHLEGLGPIPLGFLLKYNGEIIVATDDHYYDPGYITYRFVVPPTKLKVGKYVVLVYLGRHQLASTEFTVEKP
jgi:hypothetical protein